MSLAKLAREGSEPLPAFVQKRVIRPCGGAKTNVQNNFEARIEFHGAVKQIGTSIRLLAQPKSMRSIIDATQREQRLGSA